MRPDDVQITKPCPIDFGAIADPAKRRSYCAHCDKHVHNLSALTERQADGLIAAYDAGEIDEELCITYTPDDRGGIRFRPSRRQVLMAAVTTAVVGLSAPVSAQASGAVDLDPDRPSLLETLRDWWYGTDETETETGTETETETEAEVPKPPQPDPLQMPAGGMRPPMPAGGLRPAPPPPKKR